MLIYQRDFSHNHMAMMCACVCVKKIFTGNILNMKNLKASDENKMDFFIKYH